MENTIEIEKTKKIWLQIIDNRSKSSNFRWTQETRIDAVRKYGLAKATIATFLKNEAKIRQFFAQRHVARNSERKRLRKVEDDDLELELFEWITKKRRQGVLLDGPTIKADSYLHLLCLQSHRHHLYCRYTVFIISNRHALPCWK